MPSLSLDHFHCIFCGHYFYNLEEFERHHIIDHDILEWKIDEDRQGSRENDGDKEHDDNLGAQPLSSRHPCLGIMFPTP
jgi:hypothetical protein